MERRDQGWRCDVCTASNADLYNNSDIEDKLCMICCQSYRLAMKQTSEGDWVHLVCARWTPSVTFGDNITMVLIHPHSLT
jgi:hypothetical protein